MSARYEDRWDMVRFNSVVCLKTQDEMEISEKAGDYYFCGEEEKEPASRESFLEERGIWIAV